MQTVDPEAHRHDMSTNTISNTAQSHLDAVGRLYAGYGSGDIDAVLDQLADDVDWAAEAAGTAVPWYGPHRGKKEVPRFFQAIGSNVDVSEFDIIGMTASETDVVTTVHWTYTVKANGKTASMYMQHWFRFADGKIVFFRGSEDSAQSVAAFRND
jgi:ketosteroid isomerase-like protein